MRALIVFILVFFSTTAQAATTITAQVVRNQSGSGSTFISSGFPFPPGLVTEQTITAGTIKVLVSGSEVAANISALRGRHSDGSVRSALIQFSIPSMTSGQVISTATSVIIDGGVRANTDPAYVRPTLAIVQNNNVILPTDASYLVSTQITFQKLLPFGSGTTAEENQYTTLANDRFDALVANPNYGTADYEQARAMLTMWARSGNKKYFNQAFSQVNTWLDYNTPGVDGNGTACVAAPYVNPDGRVFVDSQGCGIPSEPQTGRAFSYASMYLLTGYRDYWSIVAHLVQRQQSAVTSQAVASAGNLSIINLSTYDRQRFNYNERYGVLLAALMVDATAPISGEFHTGRTMVWSDQLAWTLNALKTLEWNVSWIPFSSGSGTVPVDGTTITQGASTATLLGVYGDKNGEKTESGTVVPSSGYLQVAYIADGAISAGSLGGISATATGPSTTDYRNGMTGVRSNSPREGDLLPVFQMVFPTNFLIDYYLLVNADTRIPLMVKKNLDIALNNINTMVPGDSNYGNDGGIWGNPVYGKPYFLEEPISTEPKECFELPEYARSVAFVLKTIGDDTVNGATYSTWYNRLIDTANNSPVLIWQWKLFGQFYGFGADAPWMMAQSSLPTPSFRVPTNYTSIPGSKPDLQRTSTALILRIKADGKIFRVAQ